MTNSTDYLELMKRELVRMDYSDDTVETYGICLKQLSAHFPTISTESISLEQIKDYFNFLIVRKRASPSYLYQNRSALHFFYNSVIKKDYDLSLLCCKHKNDVVNI
jgi:hypothetical protein